MIRTNIYVTEDQHEYLAEQAKATGKTASDIVRSAIDRMRAQTVYISDTIEMAEEVHPDFTYEQFQAWLLFRWRLKYEGKDYRNGNGEVKAMFEEILTILRGNHDNSHG